LTSDLDLVRRCLDGDRVAWSDLLARYGDLVHGLLHRTGLDADACSDGFQEVAIALWKSLPRLRRTERLLPWLAVTTKRVGWRLRKRTRARDHRQAEAARPERDAGPGPEATLASLEEEQIVREALGALGERCRRLLSALYFATGEASYDDISARLGIPRGSIGPTRQRCLETLRKEVEARGLRPDRVSADAPAASTKVERPTGRHRGRPS
jgi:RNA polymerase sigma factor (sigma-70 family)